MAGFTLPVSGVLGIQSDAAPAFYLNSDYTAESVKAYAKSAAVGVDLVFTIYAGANAWMAFLALADAAVVDHDVMLVGDAVNAD